MEYKLQIAGRYNTLEDCEFVFPLGTNFITGQNGSGKSSLLKAVTLALFRKAVGDRGHEWTKKELPDGYYTLKLANGIFDVTNGRTEKEGLIFKGIYPLGELKGEREENHNKFLGWLDIKPRQAFSTILERIQFDPASPSIFTFQQKTLIESVTSALSERTRVYQSCFDNLTVKRKLIEEELKQARRDAQNISGSEYVSTTEIEQEIGLEYVKVNGRPESFKLTYFERNLNELQQNLQALETGQKAFIATVNKQTQLLRSQLSDTEFDEEQVRRERDEILKKLTTLDNEIVRLRNSLVSPKPCENCGALLLESKDKYVKADLKAIEKVKETIIDKIFSHDGAKHTKENLDKIIKLAESKRQLAQLEIKLSEKTAEYEKAIIEKKDKIQVIYAEIKSCKEAKPFWNKIAELRQRLAIVKDNNERLEKFNAQAKIIKEFEQKFLRYDFHRTGGIRDLLYGHFTNQCSRFSSAVNEVLYDCDLGKIEFVPEFGKDGNIEKIRLRHFEKGEWRPYNEREDSLRKILDLAAWLANKNLNPKKVDCLKLMLLDDFAHVYDERLGRFLNYLSLQPVVLLFAWAYKDALKLFKPVQTIVLGE